MATLRTKADLISFIQSKVYQNTSNAVTGQMAQDAMLDMVEAIFGGDLASASEVLTVEIYNGKPVYSRLFIGGAVNHGDDITIQGNLGFTIDRNAIWIDYSHSSMMSIISGVCFSLPGFITIKEINTPNGNFEIFWQAAAYIDSYLVVLKYTK